MQISEREEKIEYILNELTIEEKIGMIHGTGLFHTEGVNRLNIPPLFMSDGPMGVRAEFEDAFWKLIGNSDDLVTYCPSNTAIAMTWNRELAKQSGKVLGEETRGRGKDIILGPGINIKRNPLCGRNFEYFSEDPYVTSEMAVPFIEGVETADVAACVKHFALNSQETERLWVNVEVDERALREIYLPGFEAAIKSAHSKSIMGAYNLFRGQHCCESKALLGDILRKEWNYDGLIVSDWGGVHHTKEAAQSPLDIEMSVTNDFDNYCMARPLLTAVKNGEIQEEVINEKIRNILRLMFRLKMIEAEVSVAEDGKVQVFVTRGEARKKGSYNTPEHRKAVLDTARESVVLLKNEEQLLPLAPEKLKKLLVIGDNGARLHAYGGGSAEIKALYEISPLMGLKCCLGGNCEVRYARGYFVPDQEEKEFNWQADSLEPAVREEKAEGYRQRAITETIRLREEALQLAKEYESVIYVGGLNHEQDVEGQDRENMKLPYEQDRLITELLEIRPDMVVVMMAGSPVEMSSWISQTKAVIWYGYSGMEGGTALAEVLLGYTNPSGKLTETLPFRMEDTGVGAFGEFPGRELMPEEKEKMDAHLTEEYRDSIFVGYRYYDKFHVPVQFAFGHGLSYTTFSYQNLKAEWKEENAREKLIVSVDVTNTGARAGKEVVELYIGEKQVSRENPVKELKGFEKVSLELGQTKSVSIELPVEAFAHYHTGNGKWMVKEGTYILYVGSSLLDIRETIEINCKEKECEKSCGCMM